ncbi:LysR substrate-binding domain-containing protein [Rhizobium mongolense]|uniref:LysR substrate-binding domain-containing protein n=1 Tax=Rhizobium mongolense TaxID=57676 RepID=UPI003558B648
MRSLAGLIDFECAARWQSFKLASLELHKTPAAVSQQIKTLEQTLGFPLFERHPRGVTITDKGKELAETVAKAVLLLDQKINDLADGGGDRVLRVSTTHSFAMKWLIPRLPRFNLAYPEVDFRLEATDEPVPLNSGKCDVVVRHASYEPHAADDLTFPDRFVMVASPSLLERTGRPDLLIDDIDGLPIIYEGSTHPWMLLLEARGMLGKTLSFTRAFSHAGLLVQAAVSGDGVALVSAAIASDDILAGRLVMAADLFVPSSYCYRVLTASSSATKIQVKHFRSWIGEEMRRCT